MKICMVAYSFYEYDSRIRRMAESLIERGDEVDVICLRETNNLQMPEENHINHVHVIRIQKRQYNEKGAFCFLKRLLMFFIRSSFKLTLLHLRKRYDLIHVHSVPDFMVFSALLPRLLGAKVILDIHDLVPEFYARKFNLRPEHPLIRLLMLVEKWSGQFAHHVVTVTHAWKQTLCRRSVPEGRCTVLFNAADPKIFPRQSYPWRPNSREFRLLFYGTLGEHWGVDVVIRAMDAVLSKIPTARFYIFGDGHYRKALLELTNKLQLSQYVVFNQGFVPVEKLPQLIRDADVGLVPVKSGIFADEALSNKLMEFVAVGIPVVVSRTKAATAYFDEDMVMFFEPENEIDLARCIIELYEHPGKRKQLSQRADRFYEQHNWEQYKKIYYELIDTLCHRNGVLQNRLFQN